MTCFELCVSPVLMKNQNIWKMWNVQYTGDIQYNGGYHEYSVGCSVHRGVTMSTVKGYREYTGGCSVHWGNHKYTGGLPR